MKKTLVIIMTTALCFYSFAQNTKTKIGEIASRKETTLIREILDKNFFSGITGRLDFRYVVYTDVSTGEIVGGLEVETSSGGIFEIGRSSAVFIDEDEISFLERWITYFRDEWYNTKPDHFTELIFKSNGGCEFRFYYNPAVAGKLAPNKWLLNASTSEVYDTDFSYILKDETLDNLLMVFGKAKKLINKNE